MDEAANLERINSAATITNDSDCLSNAKLLDRTQTDLDSDSDFFTEPPAPNSSSMITDPHAHSSESGRIERGEHARKPLSSVSQIVAHAAKGACSSYVLAFGLRGGVSFLLSLTKVVKGKAKLRDSLRFLFADYVFRFSNMVGSFSFIWKLVSNYLRFRESKKVSPPVSKRSSLMIARRNAFIAGSLAGTSVLFETYENRLAVMQQFGVRALQASYNGLKARNLFSFAHGDTLLFSIACGSIMYAYVMAPDTIPKEYNNWMVQTARVSRESLAISRQNNRRIENPSKFQPIDFDTIYDCINRHGGTNAVVALQQAATAYDARIRPDGTLPIVPCSIIHPTDCNCLSYNTALAFKIMSGIAPVYATLNFVPMVLLKTRALMANPISLPLKGIRSTIVSSAFLTAYVGIYMAGICGVRNLVKYEWMHQDHKIMYYILGCIASGTSILMEKKPRRAELAMYVLPKGLQSLFLVMQRRRWIYHVPGSETALSCLSFGVLMTFYQLEPQALSPLLVRILDKVIGKY
ncbi:hypothetical protein HDU77_011134 [Chytriomyces hyalinus]|nr:hypothetical protein HDU77_011134 [Chytriomyces hyalinus]